MANNNSFRFKQFSISQDKCAMKVGTDGVLLGAWAEGGNNILDIGCGTGIIAMMMAQRYPNSKIKAIDISLNSVLQTKENVQKSVFKMQIEVEHKSIQEYCESTNNHNSFDSIVSNPPFFSNSLKNNSAEKTLARHCDSLSYSELFKCVELLLTNKGTFSCIIPKDCLNTFLSESYIYGMFLHKQINIKTKENKLPKRVLLSFSKTRKYDLEIEDVVLNNNNNERSSWYINLTKDFYLY